MSLSNAIRRKLEKDIESAAAGMTDVGVERPNYDAVPQTVKGKNRTFYPSLYVDLDSLDTPLDDAKPGTVCKIIAIGVVKSRGERENDDGTTGGEVCFEIQKMAILPNGADSTVLPQAEYEGD